MKKLTNFIRKYIIVYHTAVQDGSTPRNLKIITGQINIKKIITIRRKYVIIVYLCIKYSKLKFLYKLRLFIHKRLQAYECLER